MRAPFMMTLRPCGLPCNFAKQYDRSHIRCKAALHIDKSKFAHGRPKTRQGRRLKFAAWAVGARGDRIASFGSLAGCCAQAHAIIAGLGTENNAAAIATVPMNVHRSIIE